MSKQTKPASAKQKELIVDLYQRLGKPIPTVNELDGLIYSTANVLIRALIKEDEGGDSANTEVINKQDVNSPSLNIGDRVKDRRRILLMLPEIERFIDAMEDSGASMNTLEVLDMMLDVAVDTMKPSSRAPRLPWDGDGDPIVRYRSDMNTIGYWKNWLKDYTVSGDYGCRHWGSYIGKEGLRICFFNMQRGTMIKLRPHQFMGYILSLNWKMDKGVGLLDAEATRICDNPICLNPNHWKLRSENNVVDL